MPYRAIAALAAAGFADSAYLTAVKLLNLAPACPLGGGAAGCSDILSSEYATLFGVVPLSAVGMLAYGGVAALALAGTRQAGTGALADAEASSSGGGGEPSAAQQAAESPLRTAVLAGGLALASCSAVLLWLLATRFDGALCPYCLASAACSFAIAALAASGFRARELGAAAAPGAGVVATTLLLLSLGLGSPDLSLAGGYDLDYALPAVTTSSTPQGVALAQRLRDGGARMYGAFWCSHCYDQKQAFGAEAMQAFPYVECYPDGLHKVRPRAPTNPQTAACGSGEQPADVCT
jgi:uncharacterized membrane protein